MDSPDWVKRVTPPSKIMLKTSKQQINSHTMMGLLLAVIANEGVLYWIAASLRSSR